MKIDCGIVKIDYGTPCYWVVYLRGVIELYVIYLETLLMVREEEKGKERRKSFYLLGLMRNHNPFFFSPFFTM